MHYVLDKIQIVYWDRCYSKSAQNRQIKTQCIESIWPTPWPGSDKTSWSTDFGPMRDDRSSRNCKQTSSPSPVLLSDGAIAWVLLGCDHVNLKTFFDRVVKFKFQTGCLVPPGRTRVRNDSERSLGDCTQLSSAYQYSGEDVFGLTFGERNF